MNLKSRKQKFIELIIQILEEQFSSIKPDFKIISNYIDDKYIERYLNKL